MKTSNKIKIIVFTLILIIISLLCITANAEDARTSGGWNLSLLDAISRGNIGDKVSLGTYSMNADICQCIQELKAGGSYGVITNIIKINEGNNKPIYFTIQNRKKCNNS